MSGCLCNRLFLLSVQKSVEIFSSVGPHPWRRPQTAQQTLPYREMYKDGICRVDGRLYTKSMEYEDINYQLAQADNRKHGSMSPIIKNSAMLFPI